MNSCLKNVVKTTLKTAALTAFAALVVSSGVPSTASAQELDFKEYRKFLMSGDSANKKLAIQTTCTDSEGEVFRIGETGYDECLNSAREALKRKHAGSGEKSEIIQAPTTGTTIHIGE